MVGLEGEGGTRAVKEVAVKNVPVKKAAPKKAAPKKAETGGGGLFANAFANVEIKESAPTKVVKKTAPKKVAKAAPSGVPRLVNWRVSRDGGIDGQIVGSPNFPDGEGITTSPIVKGRLDSGEIVVTGSGSKYYLD
mmetsp:Transcript_23079/g.47854  ORF Transcript_23079/g.47854 Transcript_23079/m.47854 type:complete len:136 (+) Transcript_23079:2-409(+)